MDNQGNIIAIKYAKIKQNQVKSKRTSDLSLRITPDKLYDKQDYESNTTRKTTITIKRTQSSGATAIKQQQNSLRQAIILQ